MPQSKRTIAFILVTGILFSVFVFVVKQKASNSFAPQTIQIINTHEHIQSIDVVPKYLEAMKKVGIGKTILVGSPEATILNGRKGFFGEEKYNREVLKIAKKYPDSFIAFPTINVADPDKLNKVKQHIRMGGKGLKLYSGHRIFYSLPLDDASMFPIYQYFEKRQIPILIHVNAGYYQKEFENVLKKFPKLKIICPHFCLSTIKLERFEYLMDRYPNLYTDTSFGDLELLIAAMKRFSKRPKQFRNIIEKYQDRILFGTDMVITDASYKTVDWLAEVAQGYRDMLEKGQYTFSGIPDMELRGLRLDEAILKKIYRTNYEKLSYNQSFNE